MKVFINMVLNGIALKEGIPLPFSIDQTSGTFILILICFILFGFKYRHGFVNLDKNTMHMFSFRKDRETLYNIVSRSFWYKYYIIIEFAIIVSISIYNILIKSNTINNTEHNALRTILLFILLISVFFIFKIYLYKIIGYIYRKTDEMRLLQHSQTVIIEIFGLLFFIPSLFLIYTDYLEIEIAISMIALFVLSQLLLFYRIIFYFIREKFSLLFMIAYLCSVEIIPYIFIAAGLIILYKTDELTVLW